MFCQGFSRKLFIGSPVLNMKVSLASRPFSSSSLLLKKAGKKGGKKNQEVEEDIILEAPGFYTKKYKELQDKHFQHLEKKFQVRKQALEFDPKLLDSITVGKDGKFGDFATAVKKGKVMIVTCFDKKNVNSIINAILARNDLLRMTPEKLPDNDQQLKVNLPPVTDGVKKEFVNNLKGLGEQFKKEMKTEFLNKGEMKIVKELNKKKDPLAVDIMKEFERDHKTFTVAVDGMVKKYVK